MNSRPDTENTLKTCCPPIRFIARTFVVRFCVQAGQFIARLSRHKFVWIFVGQVCGHTELALFRRVPHTADTALPVGHEGIQIVPSANLPDDTVFVVTVSGAYEGVAFSHTWKFSTGDTAIPDR